MKDSVYRFGGGKHPFSNFYPAGAVYEDLTYENGEAAFQAAKTLNRREREAFTSVSPGVAKRMGRRINLRPDWESVKYQVMLDVLRSKFNEPKLRTMLIETGDSVIVEDTTGWHDNIWGDCQCERCQHVLGHNLLGKALMEVRRELLEGV